MFKIALVNMPFAAVELPSIALTQLRAVVEKQLGERIAVETFYFNHDFTLYVGRGLYQQICDESPHTGLGDWFFRQLAFPFLGDNTADYFKRYYQTSPQLRQQVEEKRAGLADFLDRLVEHHRLAEYDLLGMTSMFAQNVATMALAARVKERRPEIVTVMGGANCEAPMGQQIVKNVEPIDFVFSGPALRNFPRFVAACLEGDEAALHRIDGVFSKQNTVFDQVDVRIFGEELPIDEAVDLDYDAFLAALEAKFPHEGVEPVLLFETSRGCWWGERAHCTFCGLNSSHMGYRAMAPQRAREQFERLFRYGDRVKRFQCVDNIMPKEYVEEVFARLTSPPGTSIFYEVKADLTAAELDILSRAGVDAVQPGIEALATSTLRLMRKGTTATRNVEFLKSCLSHGVTPAWNLLIGFPGEVEEVYASYLERMPLLVHLPPPSGVHPVRFDRYSPYFVEAKRYGLELQPFAYYELCYPFAAEDLAGMAYFFGDENVTAPYMVGVARWIDRLRQQHGLWHERWTATPRPLLYVEEDGGPEGAGVVYDSRTGDPRRRPLRPAARRLLTALDHSLRRDQLAAEVADLPEAEVRATLEELQEMGLVFEDERRLVSLVFRHKPEPRRGAIRQQEVRI